LIILSKHFLQAMEQIKRRGPQYFLFLIIVFAGLILVISLEPDRKMKMNHQSMDKDNKSPDMVNNDTSLTEINEMKVKDDLSSMDQVKDTVLSIKEAMENEMDSDHKDINAYFEALLKSYQKVKHQSRKDVVIRYYRKSKDGKVVNSLEELGFYIHERPTDNSLKDLYSNTIYYGDSVRREDILIVAYQLKRAGMQLQAVEHSRFGDGWKSHSIELGTDIAMLKSPELSLDSIKYIIENNPYLKTHL